MGLAVRIIPTILTRGRTMVKGSQFNSWRTVGVTAQAVRIHQARGVDEICLLDIGATPEGRGPDLDLVRELSAKFFSPLAVGGGVKTVKDVRALLEAGADKVVVGNEAILRPELIGELADIVGSQAIVYSLNYKMGCQLCEGEEAVYPLGVVRRARQAEEEGAGEILLNAIEREGMMGGYDLVTLRAVTDAVSIPVVAHCGAGTYQHMLEAIQAGASAVAAGAMFQFSENTPAGAARYLHEHGIETRIEGGAVVT